MLPELVHDLEVLERIDLVLYPFTLSHLHVGRVDVVLQNSAGIGPRELFNPRHCFDVHVQ